MPDASAFGDAGLATVLISSASVGISRVVEWLKAWIPEAHKTPKGVTFKRGRKTVLIPNAALWPTVSGLLGIAFFSGLFLTYRYNVFGLQDWLTTALSGVTTSVGSSVAYRAQNLGSKKTGSEDVNSAQATGPSSTESEL